MCFFRLKFSAHNKFHCDVPAFNLKLIHALDMVMTICTFPVRTETRHTKYVIDVLSCHINDKMNGNLSFSYY